MYGGRSNGRKNNPNFQKTTMTARDGVKQTVYRKIQKKEKKGVGTPDKRRGAFKGQPSAPSNSGVLYSQPNTINQVMGQPQLGAAQTQSALNISVMSALSDQALQKFKTVSLNSPPNPAKVMRLIQTESRAGISGEGKH